MLDLIKTSLFQYYGSDWLAAALLIVYLYLIGEKKRFGFIIGIFSACSWLIYAYLTHSIANFMINILTIFLFIQNYRKWKTKA